MKLTRVCFKLMPLHRLNLLERTLCADIAAITKETSSKPMQHNSMRYGLIETNSETLCLYDLCSLPNDCAFWTTLAIAGPLCTLPVEAADGDVQEGN